MAAAYVYPHVGNDPLFAWEAVEDLSNSDEHYRRLRQWADRHVVIALDWAEGVKSITGQDRLDRAEKYFRRFLEEENVVGVMNCLPNWYYGRWVQFLRRVEHWQKQGFTRDELCYLRERFEIFWEK